MTQNTMRVVREHVLPVMAHLQVEGRLADPAEARALRDRYLPVLLHFAAGDGMAMDDLHRAMLGIERAAFLASEHELSQQACWAANYTLLLCSAGYQELIRVAVMGPMQRVGVRIDEDLR